MVKNFFLISSLNLPSLSWKPLLFVLSQQALLKIFSPSLLQASFRYRKAAIRSPHSLLYSRLKSPNSVSLSSHERCSSPQIIFVALLWTRSNISMSRLCWEAPELDTVLQVGSHQSGVEGQNLLARPAGHVSLDASQDMAGLLGCERSLPDHVQLFIHQYPQVLLSRSASGVPTTPLSLVLSANLLSMHLISLSHWWKC